MGHSVETHLAAYSCWCGDDVVDEAFAKAEQRLLPLAGRTERAIFGAASWRMVRPTPPSDGWSR